MKMTFSPNTNFQLGLVFWGKVIRILNIPEDYSIGLVIALGYPAEKPICEDVDKNSSIKYYRDSSGIMHVPKRKLKDIIHFNCIKE